MCHGEECADTDSYDLNMDLQPRNTSVETDCATGIHATRSGGYITVSDEERHVLWQNRGEMECSELVLFSIPYSVFVIVRE